MDKKQNINFLSTNKYADLKVQQDILAFHNKGNIHVDKLFHSAIHYPPLPLNSLQSLEGYDTEINPFHYQSIPCESSRDITIRRNRSAAEFANTSIDFSLLQTLLNESFAANDNLRRPYPSGGALYTIEPLCLIFQERLVGAPQSGIYHYRANFKKLQLLKEAKTEDLIKHILDVETEKTHQANFILIYIINLSKAIVKYRYRGYRLAFMEVGAMFQQADLVAKELGLKNKISSSFNDFQVTKFIELDRVCFIPAVMQLFGK